MLNNGCVWAGSCAEAFACANGKLNHGVFITSLWTTSAHGSFGAAFPLSIETLATHCLVQSLLSISSPIEYQNILHIMFFLFRGVFCWQNYLNICTKEHSLTVKDLTDVISVSSQRHEWIFICIFLQSFTVINILQQQSPLALLSAIRLMNILFFCIFGLILLTWMWI